MLHSTAVRTIGVFFEPVPRSKSQRNITAQATKIEADVAHRDEKGFRVGAWHRRAAQAVKEREEELVAGYSELTFTAVVNVTAADIDELDRSCSDIVQIAASAGIELRPLHGRHDQALHALLPCAEHSPLNDRTDMNLHPFKRPDETDTWYNCNGTFLRVLIVGSPIVDVLAETDTMEITMQRFVVIASTGVDQLNETTNRLIYASELQGLVLEPATGHHRYILDRLRTATLQAEDL